MGRRVRPKNITNENEMIKFLEANLEYEYPFVQEAWDKAVESVANYTGKNKVSVSGKYFQLLGLAQYKNIGQELRNAQYKQLREDNEDVVLEDILGNDSEESDFIRELIEIYFSTVRDEEDLKFVVDRLADYYSNYEFNEGSDKFLVVSAVSDELALRELYSQRTRGSVNEKQVKEVKEGYMKTLTGLKLLKSDKKQDEGKNKFTAFVDELTRTGELNIKTTEYPQDQIDLLIEATRRSIVGAYDG